MWRDSYHPICLSSVVKSFHYNLYVNISILDTFAIQIPSDIGFIKERDYYDIGKTCTAAYKWIFERTLYSCLLGSWVVSLIELLFELRDF